MDANAGTKKENPQKPKQGQPTNPKDKPELKEVRNLGQRVVVYGVRVTYNSCRESVHLVADHRINKYLQTLEMTTAENNVVVIPMSKIDSIECDQRYIQKLNQRFQQSVQAPKKPGDKPKGGEDV
ncbi:MAG: hypothetical protein GWN93_27020 [Deltaproteobacteria bacterium]|nr:hypothetical protein [Deltaproteobacteria bacterium]